MGIRLVPVILAGGRGERFWPLSRRHRPKQLLPLLSERSMLADTLGRLEGLSSPGDAWVITARDLESAVREAVPSVPRAQVVGEPVGKNTAPAIALACKWLESAGEDVVVVVLPSDHRIEPAEKFREELGRAARLARERRVIVTFGIPPTRPETGYGYIELGGALDLAPDFHSVAAFREKPDAATAARYVGDGKHLWNAGMFVFTPEVMLEELAAHAPEVTALLPALPAGPGDEKETARALERFYSAAPSISIDYAVMERSQRAVVARAGFSWDDLGSWAALATPEGADADGNVVRGPAILHDSRGVIAFADGGLVATVGVENLIVVRTGDVTLVCSRDRAQDVRAIVERLKREKRGRMDSFRPAERGSRALLLSLLVALAAAPPYDPSEEITPEELASIPEPVPATPSRVPSAEPAPRGVKAPPAALEPRSDSSRVTITPSLPSASDASRPSGAWIWCVQILATPDRALAERVAREAAESLGTTSRVDRDPPLYKVRLGGFATEAEAQVLKGRAVEMGYPGAFRVKITVRGTDE